MFADNALLPLTPSIDQPASVLVLDDQPEIRSLVRDILSPQNYHVATAASLAEAEKALNDMPFDVVLVDIFIKGTGTEESGLSLIPRVQEFQPNTPVIVMSGMANMNDVLDALKAGAYDMITKPFNMIDLLHAVNRGVEKKRMADENTRLVHELRQERDLLEQRVRAATNNLRNTVENMRELNEQLATMFELGQAWTADVSAEVMMHRILDLLHDAIIFDGAFCLLYDLKGQGILLTHAEGEGSEPQMEHLKRYFASEGAGLIRLASGPEPFGGELLLAHYHQSSGQRIPIKTVLFPLYIPQTLVGIFGLTRPAGAAESLGHSEQRILSVAIAHLLAGLEQRNFVARSGQLAGLGELIAEIAHDLRNPMTALRGASRMLIDGWSDDAKRGRCLDEITGNLTRMESLVAELVNFYNPRDMNIVSMDLYALLDKAVQVTTALMSQKDISVDLNYAGPPIKILGLSRNLIEAFINLISNACQAMQPGGKLILGATDQLSETDRGALLKNNRQPSRYVRVTVADNGCGIPPENQDKVFKRFFTTRPEGHGLGLSAVVRVLKKNLGDIRFESVVGQGTTFFVYLPRA